MVTLRELRPRPPWEDGHFIGGHVVLDLTNTVFNRAHPTTDNELLKSPVAALTWCASAGLFEDPPDLSDAAADALVSQLRAVREDAWAVFDAVSRAAPVPVIPFGALLERGGAGLRDGRLRGFDAALERLDVDWAEPDAVPAALALLAVQAVFTLPPERVRACARCGWLFLDSSRGGRRRWCSMETCGNREKASRHRQGRR